MRTIIQSIIASFTIDLIYLVVILIVSYINTMNDKANVTWENAENLPNEVAFRSTGAPLFFPFTFIGAALVCALIFITFDRILG